MPSFRHHASELGVAHRVVFLGHVDEDTLLSCYARCRAVYFAPWMEDYGFVTMEAFRSRKPVLTCVDSGGPAEIVAAGRSGCVLPPEPLQIARQLDVWAQNADLAARCVGRPLPAPRPMLPA